MSKHKLSVLLLSACFIFSCNQRQDDLFKEVPARTMTIRTVIIKDATAFNSSGHPWDIIDSSYADLYVEIWNEKSGLKRKTGIIMNADPSETYTLHFDPEFIVSNPTTADINWKLYDYDTGILGPQEIGSRSLLIRTYGQTSDGLPSFVNGIHVQFEAEYEY